MAQKKSKHLTIFLKAPFYLFIAWMLGFLLFLARLPGPYSADTIKADAIVVLTGGPKRLEVGLNLMTGKHAQKMMVSGVHKDVRIRELIALTGADQALFNCCITLDRAAQNTLENAAETAKWVSKNAFNSIILVTADYHIQRSVVLFRKSMPQITVIPFPVKTHMSILKIAKEYNKYLATLILELVDY